MAGQGIVSLGRRYLDWSRRGALPANVGPTERWGSALIGGALLWSGIQRRSFRGVLLSVLGGDLVYRGLTGQSPLYRILGINTATRPPATAVPARQGYKVEETVVIHRPIEDVYRAWENLENLPQIMNQLVSVEKTGDGRSHWAAKGPLGATIEWDAEVIQQTHNSLISWRSLPGSQVDTAGSVHFEPLANGKGTRVRVSMKYDPPGGKVGASIVSFLGQGLREKLHEDLRRFKQTMETTQSTTAG